MAIRISYNLEVSINNYRNSEAKDIENLFLYEYDLHKDLATQGGVEHSDIEENLLEFSLLYPEYLFILYGNEIDNELLWVKYFKNGFFQYEEAIITYPEFDESKLK